MRWQRPYWPMLAWAAAIWIFSTETFSFSRTNRFIAPVLHWFFPRASAQTLHWMHFVIRKSAHLVEYFIFSLLVLHSIRGERKGWQWRWGLITIAVAAGYAAVDELEFEPTRGSSMSDVGLDTLGEVLAQLCAGWWLLRHRRPPKTERVELPGGAPPPDKVCYCLQGGVMGGGLLRQTTLALAFISLTSSAASASDPLQYKLRFERPNTHLMDIMISATGLPGPDAEFAMPDWAPGSYHIENYAAQVQGFSAIGPEGQRLPWHKTDSRTWRIALGRATSLTVHYQIYGNTLANNQAQYNARHAFIAGPAVWMYLVNGKDRPVRLTIDLPQGWRIAPGMERLPDNSLAAADYDWFADSPIEISDFIESTFQVQGTTYHFVVHDMEGRKDFAKFEADTRKIVEATLPLFTPLSNGPRAAPFADYWFLFHIWPRAGGGLEHLNSTQINFSKDWDNTDVNPEFLTEYDLKLFVTAHEFFHAWNVKRLRPKPLGPFDYSQIVHTPSLWISEGITDYYALLALVRAGLISPEDYLGILSRLLTKFEAEPGRAERSLAETSWDTWFSDLRTENNLANTTYSYYDGGWIIGHLLDFEIRQNTRNQKSLDDWMRLLYERYAPPKPGFIPEDAVKAASEVAGTDLSDFFLRYVSGKEALPYQMYFGYAGVDVQVLNEPSQPFLGVSMERNEDGRARLKNIIPGSPAETAGLDRDDVILAVDSKAVDEDGFLHTIEAHKPGDTLRITLLRQGELKDFPVPLIANPYPTYVLKPMEHPDELQRKIYRSWIGLK